MDVFSKGECLAFSSTSLADVIFGNKIAINHLLAKEIPLDFISSQLLIRVSEILAWI